MTPKEKLEEAKEKCEGARRALLRAARSYGWLAKPLPPEGYTHIPTLLSELTRSTTDLVRLARCAFEYHQAYTNESRCMADVAGTSSIDERSKLY
jgi:hypothetical protein